MDKNKLVYMVLLISFVAGIIILDVSFYLKNSNALGKVNIVRKFYEVNYISNNYNIKEKNGTLDITTNGVDELYFDIYNSGNVNAYVSEYSIYGLSTNLEEEDIVIDTSIKKNDVVKSGQTKRVYIDVDCDNCKFDENTEIKFKVKYLFKE